MSTQVQVQVLEQPKTQQVTVGYKFVTKDLQSRNGVCTWKLGEWQKANGKLVCCSNGLHAALTPLDSLQYVYGDRWFIVEARGDITCIDTSGEVHDDKFCAREMRLVQEIPVDKVLVQFAILCARRCYKHYKKQYPDDTAVIGAIKAAAKCLRNPTPANVSAARSAARSAESAAWSAKSAESAARSAESAARSAESAEREAQQRTLQKLIRKYTKTEVPQQ